MCKLIESGSALFADLATKRHEVCLFGCLSSSLLNCLLDCPSRGLFIELPIEWVSIQWILLEPTSKASDHLKLKV